MSIYLFQAFLIGFVGLLVHPKRSNRRKRQYLFFVFLLLVVVSGLRAYSVGADTMNYVRMFQSTDYIGVINTRIEMGFMIYLKNLHRISSDPRIMLFTSSIICVGTICLFTYRFSKDAIMSMMLYVLMGPYFSQLSAMRQCLAVSFATIGFMILLDSKALWQKILSGGCILLAMTFHTVSAVLFIPYIFLLRSEKKDSLTNMTVGKVLFRAFGIAIVAFLGYSLVMTLAARLFPMYTYYFLGTWSDSNYNASLMNTAISVIFACAGAVVFKNRRLNMVQGFAAVMIGFVVIFNVLSMRMEIWNRVTGMFSIYTYLLWTPEFTSEIRNVKNRWVVNGGIILGALAYMLVVLTFRPEWTMVVPYRLR